MKNVETMVVIVAFCALGLLIYNSNTNKNMNPMTSSHLGNSNSAPSASMPSSHTDMYAGASGLKTNTYNMPSHSMNDDPTMLLPNDANSKWSNLNPSGDGQLKNINLLSVQNLIGQNTVGSTKKNMNLQLRSEPINPRNNVSPWLQSTIEPDLMRKPLEIGQGEN
jgi:hypothetical protein